MSIMTVNVTRISAGQAGVAYLLRGHGCEQARQGPEGYYLRGAGAGPAGRWWGAGCARLGLEAGAEAAGADVRAVFDYLADPRVMRAAEERIAADGLAGAAAEAVRQQAAAAGRLGNEPYKFRSLPERVAARLAAEGTSAAADPERAEQIRIEEAQRGTRAAAGFYDITFSHGKSSSLYYAGLLAAGRAEDAAAFKHCHDAAVADALAWLQAEAGYARTGHHGQGKDGRPGTGRFVTARQWTAAVFDHLTNRDGEPQLHSHAAVSSRARVTDTDGSVKYRNLDSWSITKARLGAAAVYESSFEQRVMQRFPVVYRMRPDGKGRELAGISQAEREAFSTRRGQVTAQVDAWAAEYERKHGYPPSAYARTVMAQAAALVTRPGKELAGGEAELAARWERMAGQRLADSLADLTGRADSAGIAARARGGAEWDRGEVTAAGLAAVQEKRATWSAAELSFHISQALPEGAEAGRNRAELVAELTGEALRSGKVMQVRGLELIEVPAELRRAEDGRSIYRPGRDERYSLLSHLKAEEQTAARARATGAPALGPEQARAAIGGAGTGRNYAFSADQGAVVAGVLTDGHWISVMRGPAGTGKSTAQGALAAGWTQHTGGRVLGLATAERAARVLADAGVRPELVVNTTRFLDRAAGHGPREEVDRWRLRPGDLVIVDEAAMTSTSHLVRIARLADDAGAKVVFCGDDGQLSAVDAGGLFRQLINDPGVPRYELETVRRFREPDGSIREWEAAASLQLRRGEAAALQAYAAHGRIRGGTAEQMAAEIRRGYVADALAGRHAAVMASTEDKAAELAAGIRSDLVALGLAEPDGVPLRDGNVAGTGDLVQARRIDWQIEDDNGQPVLTRNLYRVTGRRADGSLTARRVEDARDSEGREVLAGTVRFPAEYVRAEITLGYAGTVHAEQGGTVASGYEYADRSTGREALYTGLTRGAGTNRVFVETQRAADEHQAEELDSDPLAELAAALGRQQAERSASDTLREELDYQESLPATAPVWDDIVARHTRRQYARELHETLGEESCKRLAAEDPASVYRRLREAELAGHDPGRLIREAAAGRPLADADSLAALYYWRLERRIAQRQPEHEPAGAGWAERTPDIPGRAGDYARLLAAAQDARREALGQQAAADPPEWALRTLGPIPGDPAERLEWEQRAGQVAAYRERYHVDAPGTIIGPAPAAGMADQQHEWQAAAAALGRTEAEQQLAAASDGALREMTAAWEREQAWAPPHVADELARTIQARDHHAAQAAITRRQAELAADPAERARLAGRANGYQLLGGQLVGQARQYEEIHAARLAWARETAPQRDAAAAARAELARRQADQQAREPATAESPATPAASLEPARAQAEPEQAAAAVHTATARPDPAQEPEPAVETAPGEQASELRDLTAAVQAARDAVERIEARQAERAAEEATAEETRRSEQHRAAEQQRQEERAAEADRGGPEIEP